MVSEKMNENTDVDDNIPVCRFVGQIYEPNMVPVVSEDEAGPLPLTKEI